jgi:hypothetical protein
MRRGEDEGGQYVVRDAQKIYIEVLDTGIAPRRRNKGDLFSTLYHKHSVPALKDLGCPGALVWVALVWRWKIEGRNTVKLPTGKLKAWGVSQQTYTKALRRLEATGRVRVTSLGPGRAPMVEAVHGW